MFVRSIALLLCLVVVALVSGERRVQIKLGPLSTSQSVSHIEWLFPNTTTIYCLGWGVDKPVWRCRDCDEDSRVQVEARLLQFTRDLSSEYGEHTIELSRIDAATAVALDGKTLACEGSYSGIVGAASIIPMSYTAVAWAQATVNVTYLLTPVIVNSAGQRPVLVNPFSDDGRHFYSECARTCTSTTNECTCSSTAQTELHCQADGDPPVSAFEWRSGDTLLGTSPHLQVVADLFERSITCGVSNGIKETLSDSVRVVAWVKPRLLESNFLQLADAARSRPDLYAHVHLECAISGVPPPSISVRRLNGANKVVEANCRHSIGWIQPLASSLATSTSLVIWKTNSLCTVDVVGNWSSNTYWCVACQLLAENQHVCQPDRLPAESGESLPMKITPPVRQS